MSAVAAPDQMSTGGNERVRHPLFARFYARVARASEAAGAADHRDELLAGLTGRVVEIGAGTGTNFSHYPETVSEVVAVEPEPYLRRQATAAVAGAAVPVRVVEGTAGTLPIEDGWADAVVFSLVLCSIASPEHALAEAARVLGPTGELRVYEHVRADDARAARRQDRVDWLWSKFAGGCHCNRETHALIEQAGFTFTELRRFEFAPGPLPLPVGPHLIGVAAKG